VLKWARVASMAHLRTYAQARQCGHGKIVDLRRCTLQLDAPRGVLHSTARSSLGRSDALPSARGGFPPASFTRSERLLFYTVRRQRALFLLPARCGRLPAGCINAEALEGDRIVDLPQLHVEGLTKWDGSGTIVELRYIANRGILPLILCTEGSPNNEETGGRHSGRTRSGAAGNG
jgi:hypothetical protein